MILRERICIVTDTVFWEELSELLDFAQQMALKK